MKNVESTESGSQVETGFNFDFRVAVGDFTVCRKDLSSTEYLSANGAVIPNATDYPELVKELQETPAKAVTEEQWREKKHEYLALSPDFPSVPNEGGVLFFVLDLAANTIRLPDLRGMINPDMPLPSHEFEYRVRVR